MMGNEKLDWPLAKLDQIADVILGGTPSTKIQEYWTPAEVDWVTAKDVSNFPVAKIDLTERKISKLGLEKSNAKILPTFTTVIIARGATTGKVRMLAKPMAINQTCYGIVARENVAPLYLYYFFSDLYRHLRKISYGSVFESVTTRSLNSLEIKLPPLTEQKAIASVLNSLDDKIDLLQRQNKTLEALAQTIFRQWFIEEALEEWEETPLDEIADYLNGLACQKYPPENNIAKLPVLKIRELHGGISSKTDWATTEVPPEYIVENGEVIFSWSGSLMVKIWDGDKCVLNQHLFKVTSDLFPKWFYYFWTLHHLQKFIAIAESKATTMGHIKRRDLSNSMVLVPTQSEFDEMNQVISPLIDKIILNNKQCTSYLTL